MPTESESPVSWGRTIGAPLPGDPRDGELHQFLGPPPEAFDLEPHGEANGPDAHYIKDIDYPAVEEDGRLVWQYIYSPS
jgi:hypothetical protein